MALFNWAFARQHGGQFILRIEDTDHARSTAASEAAIFDALSWLGLDWDEGPNVDGPYAPYRQSERKSIYASHVETLLQNGHAFRCFCSKERLDAVRAEQQANKQTTRYDGHCASLSADEIASRIASGDAHVIRMRVPEEGDCTFTDRLRGEISIPYAQIDMQVLVKADGMPTYHLAVVVDDHLMGITHILRGEEWLNSVPKHQLLYQYFDWPMPELIHLPLLRNPDQSKLSKRKNPTSVTYYRDMGYLPEALLNYLSLMGWSMPNEEEIFSREEMVEAFDIDRITTGGPIFDQAKLSWLNGQYLRRLDASEYAERIQEWMLNTAKLEQLIPMVQERAERLSDLLPLVDYLLGNLPELSEAHFEHKSMERGDVLRCYITPWPPLMRCAIGSEMICLHCVRKWPTLDLKFRDFLFPLFIATSGRGIATAL